MNWTIIYSDSFIKDFNTLDRAIQIMVRSWIRKHLEEVNDPRLYGKPLTGNLKGFWRYRVGDYLIIAEINDYVITIRFVSIGHRKNIYK